MRSCDYVILHAEELCASILSTKNRKTNAANMIEFLLLSFNLNRKERPEYILYSSDGLLIFDKINPVHLRKK